jgi:hypothetical protein
VTHYLSPLAPPLAEQCGHWLTYYSWKAGFSIGLREK